MKARFIIAMALCLTAVHTGTAGGGLKYDTTEKRVAFAVKNLTMALRSDNAGLVESALRMSAKLKMRHPEADVTALVPALPRPGRAESWHLWLLQPAEHHSFPLHAPRHRPRPSRSNCQYRFVS